jgi:hypothetical protein
MQTTNELQSADYRDNELRSKLKSNLSFVN